ncbi:MAG: hypothetical protein O2960_25790 [Verrucomicrobia bacterium]|nr:hypothetical protein [Verrucomicrobiota bacterium]
MLAAVKEVGARATREPNFFPSAPVLQPSFQNLNPHPASTSLRSAFDSAVFRGVHAAVRTDHETRTVLTWEDWRVTDDAGWGRNGKWLLRVETERTYDIELVWPEAIDPAKIEVQIGPVRAELELTRRAEKAVLRDVRIPPGEADLTATIIRNGDREGAYHVILVRR